MNRIQFQAGMSLSEFLADYGSIPNVRPLLKNRAGLKVSSARSAKRSSILRIGVVA